MTRIFFSSEATTEDYKNVVALLFTYHLTFGNFIKGEDGYIMEVMVRGGEVAALDGVQTRRILENSGVSSIAESLTQKELA